MRDYINIGCTPCEEDCQQLGTPSYSEEAATAECRRYIEVIRQKLGEEPYGARLAVKGFAHDFGYYHEVVCYFDDEIKESMDYAFFVESHSPMTWDDVEHIPLVKPTPLADRIMERGTGVLDDRYTNGTN